MYGAPKTPFRTNCLLDSKKQGREKSLTYTKSCLYTPILTPCFKVTLQGSFSAVSTLLIARVGAFFQVFQDLQDLHSFAPLRHQKFKEISSTFCKILLEFYKISIRINVFHTDFREFSSEFHEIF